MKGNGGGGGRSRVGGGIVNRNLFLFEGQLDSEWRDLYLGEKPPPLQKGRIEDRSTAGAMQQYMRQFPEGKTARILQTRDVTV